MLSERYRPKTWADFVSQDKAVRTLRAVLGLSTFDRGAFLLTGPSGSGKTSLAWMVARHLGAADWVVQEIKGQDCSVEALRKLADSLHLRPLVGSWNVVIVNECHAMSAAARTYALELMEAPPKGSVIILTTTESEWADETLWSRFYAIRLEKPRAAAIVAHLERIAELEGFSLNGLNLKRFVQDRHGNIRKTLMDLELEAALALAEAA
jgi:DNA polymerase-3 subunit gamma/tau